MGLIGIESVFSMSSHRTGKKEEKRRGMSLKLEALETRTLLAGDTFADPEGGWAYVFNGDGAADGADYTSLDGTWDHDNGSDAWDGSVIGEGSPGGVSALNEDGTDFIRVQDPGDPRGPLGISDPSNRKQYFTHLLSSDFEDGQGPDNLDTIVDDGITIHFRVRVATAETGPIDSMFVDEEADWPAEGLGYFQHNGGKSLIAVKQVDGPTIALGLARGANVNEELFVDEDGNTVDGLILPHLLQENAASDGSDPAGTPGDLSIEAGNVYAVDDVTQWQEFWVTIEAGTTTVDDFEDGTHVVHVYSANAGNPLEATRFGITAATGNDDDESYIAIGAGATPRAGAFDLDFLAWAPGIHVPGLSTTSGLADVTQPGDELVRVDGVNDDDGNDGPPPASETVERAIDDVTQKYLNFLDLGSGFVVTPSVGSTIVSGLRLYTANDAIPRDPASYVLEGRVDDGEWVTISEGDLDLPEGRNPGGDMAVNPGLFNQTLTFENATAYTSYRVTFPTVKDADAANSMQIAEVELLGIPEPKSDITQPGDLLVRVDGENDGDGNDGPPPAAETVERVIDDVTQKYLNFLDLGSGFEVTPSAGESVVTGLRFFTANDAIPRDPASFRLEGGSGDGTFTLIAEGDLALPEGRNPGGDMPIDLSLFHQEVSFENTEAYASYRLTFPTVKDADAANSMQIAEVEFLGDIVAAPSLPGDIDGDGSVAFADFLVLSAAFGQSVDAGTGGDLDGDGSVGFSDFLILSANFGQSA